MLHHIGNTVPKWSLYEVVTHSPAPSDPFEPGVFSAIFTHGDYSVTVPGFYDGDNRFIVRFMPQDEGNWSYQTAGIAAISGSFVCTPPEENDHGPVRAIGTGFAYADGTRCLPYGTTCYAWAHQSDDTRARTVETLKTAPFNKLRMCVFPKYYRFNLRSPKIVPFEPLPDGGFNELYPNPSYYHWIEESVEALHDLGIIADIILFHPYDCWGYARMTPAADDRYLHYVISRFAAYSNVWWALSNEYDLFPMFVQQGKDWQHLGELVRSIDPYGHPRSNHNCLSYYDHSESWVTHCSLQRIDVYRHVEDTNKLLEQWSKPIVWDEIAYEGNIPDGWGSITGEELTRRFWESMIRGGYPGHAETVLLNDSESSELWWAHGGDLRGESPARIRFLRGIHEAAPECEFWQACWDLIACRHSDDYILFYHGFFRPMYRHYPATTGKKYRVEVIDTWEMSIEEKGIVEALPVNDLKFVQLPEGWGYIKVDLPAKPYIAVRLTAVDD